MRVLYKDFSDGYLSVAEVTGTTYYEEEAGSGVYRFRP